MVLFAIVVLSLICAHLAIKAHKQFLELQEVNKKYQELATVADEAEEQASQIIMQHILEDIQAIKKNNNI